MKSPESRLEGTTQKRGSSLLSRMNGASNWLRAGVAAAALLGCNPHKRHAIGTSAPDGGATLLDSGGLDAGGSELGSQQQPDAGNPPCQERCTPSSDDLDGDCLVGAADTCPNVFDQKDPATCLAFNTDGDALSNACDPCPSNPLDFGIDTDGDGRGDVCDRAPTVPDDGSDTDADGVPNVIDNCDLPNALQVDVDEDGVGTPCDCDDSDASVHPGAFDAPCDGVDSNCNGVGTLVSTSSTGRSTITGEPECQCLPGAVRVVGPNRGTCVGLTEECVVGVTGSSFVGTNADSVVGPAPEICDGLDNNCNGTVDESLSCPVRCAADLPCGTDVGACVAGVQHCVGGVLSSVCTGSVGPAASDPCDNVDNDCDGTTDNLYGTGTACPGTIGDCATKPGVYECVTPSTRMCSADDPTSPDFGGRAEICDGRDNNCDRVVDEIPFGVVGGVAGQMAVAGTPCPAVGVCGPSTFECSGTEAVVCGTIHDPNLMPDVRGREAACDGRDSNCDGTVDEGCECRTGATQACGIDTGACNPGTQACGADGRWPGADVCGGAGFVGRRAEVCNTRDDDCDGTTDNLPSGTRGQPCIVEVAGVVTDGTYACAAGGADVYCRTTP